MRRPAKTLMEAKLNSCYIHQAPSNPFQLSLVYYSCMVYKLQRNLTWIIIHEQAQCILRWIISFLQSYKKAGVAHGLVSFDISLKELTF